MTVKGHSRSSQMSQFDTACMTSYYRSTVTMVLSYIVSHIQPDAGRKSRYLCMPPVFHAPVRRDPVGISQRCLVVGN